MNWVRDNDIVNRKLEFVSGEELKISSLSKGESKVVSNEHEASNK